jgi:hypothetical protein
VQSLRHIVIEHLFSIGIVALVVAGILLLLRDSHGLPPEEERAHRFLQIDSVDYTSQLDRALFRDADCDIAGASVAEADSVLGAIDRRRIEEFTNPELKQGGERKTLTWETAAEILPMFAAFAAVYVIVLLVTVTAARTLALYRFVRRQSGRWSALRRYLASVERGGMAAAISHAGLLVNAFLRGVAVMILFSPSYVVAYALRTRFDTDNALFMIVLGVFTNGVLITLSNKFSTLLDAESRKGYVQTGLVKGLRSSYELGRSRGISWMSLLRPGRRLQGHVLRDIYCNAEIQLIPALKEHAAFMVTGLVIIEMALNIKGHLCYAMLQHILYREYDLVLLIAFGIFGVVKLTELGADVWHWLLDRRYTNDV